jgi:hypothetical protein
LSNVWDKLVPPSSIGTTTSCSSSSSTLVVYAPWLSINIGSGGCIPMFRVPTPVNMQRHTNAIISHWFPSKLWGMSSNTLHSFSWGKDSLPKNNPTNGMEFYKKNISRIKSRSMCLTYQTNICENSSTKDT